MTLVSVIIPLHNRKELLPRALNSVLKQSYRDLEILVIDDGSTDGAGDLPILKQDQRIRYLRLDTNYGVSKARNAGIANAHGSWIALLDSDDEWVPRKIEQQLQWLKFNPSFLITQSRELWIRNGQRVNPPATHEKSGGDLFTESLKRCMITPSSVIFSKDLVDEIGCFNESLPACEDYDLWLRVTSRYPVGLVPEYHLKRYGGHSDQLSSSVPMLDRFRIRSILQLLYHSPLTEEQRAEASWVCAQKASIIAQGCLKRGNQNLYVRYKAIADNLATSTHS
ncbi:MAG TPA: glycosyltransferase family 2 protein [Chitinispirillaceae bacterium]|nr:glycosyltransferase family 2 protein [Chitinispirillaceae bacterium]